MHNGVVNVTKDTLKDNTYMHIQQPVLKDVLMFESIQSYCYDDCLC